MCKDDTATPPKGGSRKRRRKTARAKRRKPLTLHTNELLAELPKLSRERLKLIAETMDVPEISALSYCILLGWEELVEETGPEIE